MIKNIITSVILICNEYSSLNWKCEVFTVLIHRFLKQGVRVSILLSWYLPKSAQKPVRHPYIAPGYVRITSGRISGVITWIWTHFRSRYHICSGTLQRSSSKRWYTVVYCNIIVLHLCHTKMDCSFIETNIYLRQ